VRQFLNTNPLVTRASWNLQTLVTELTGQQPIIVYQMGKVGSSSIVASLRSLDRKVFHIHFLTERGIAEAEAIYRTMCQNSATTYYPRARHLLGSRYLRKRLRKRGHGQKWKVITLVRDPIARNISDFFQVIDYQIPNFTARYNAGEIDIETVLDTFLNRYNHEFVLRWFDEELQPALGIDVYDTNFPRERGYHMYQNELCDLLLIKLEQLDECREEAFQRFLGLDNFQLVKANVAEEKQYADAYREFRRCITLPESYVQAVYSSRFVRHFYTDDEIEQFRAKWSHKV
jgi:hypothetical protein